MYKSYLSKKFLPTICVFLIFSTLVNLFYFSYRIRHIEKNDYFLNEFSIKVCTEHVTTAKALEVLSNISKLSKYKFFDSKTSLLKAKYKLCMVLMNNNLTNGLAVITDIKKSIELLPHRFQPYVLLSIYNHSKGNISEFNKALNIVLKMASFQHYVHFSLGEIVVRSWNILTDENKKLSRRMLKYALKYYKFRDLVFEEVQESTNVESFIELFPKTFHRVRLERYVKRNR